jgi:hypothetical protein
VGNNVCVGVTLPTLFVCLLTVLAERLAPIAGHAVIRGNFGTGAALIIVVVVILVL